MRKRYAVSENTLSFGPLIQRGLFAAIAAFCLMMLFSERSENGLAASVRATLVDGLVPVLDVLSTPVAAWDAATQSVADMMSVYEENQQLKAENQKLLQWYSTAIKLQSENDALKELAHYQPKQANSYVTAKVVGDIGNSLSQRVLINAGTEQGVQKHQAVMNESGLIGRVISVGATSAEILLMTDVNSRLPVVSESSGLRSILAGNHTELPHLAFSESRKSPTLGEVVTTAADGDLFAAGVPVGKIFSQEDGKSYIRPFVDLDSIRYVQVVSYNASSATP